jgi:PucR C-terminal helix-turn-helix domain/GGDEF-like domain
LFEEEPQTPSPPDLMPAVTGADTPVRVDRVRASLHERLQTRREEIEAALLNRIYGISDASDLPDPEYLEGLRTAVAAALDYGLAAIEQGDEHPPQMPAVLLVQARMAARLGISLDTVLRRYFAGYALLADYLLEEAEKGNLLGGPAIKSLLRTQAALFDRLLAEVSEEHAREVEAKRNRAGERRAERVQRLLAGELIDTTGIDYDFGEHHLGALAAGEGVGEALRDLARSLDCRILLIRPADGPTWAWLGARRRLDPTKLQRVAAERWPGDLLLATGEPGKGIDGWRLTHRQARAALPVAMRGRRNVVRYADVAFFASVLQDDMLMRSLREIYLVPLETERDGGAVLRKTLRAYFAAERNVASTAAALGVSRRTVANRLQTIEARIGRRLALAMSEIEAALLVDELSD